ncbi:hypothetical protein SAMN05421748_10583 [Paractinoplanes atraurantiacus]|uniref:Uncharacterized protein n=1 Tax=Paractinoplanes atraurantiacus TaxID=1036182 RepID=A0A285HNN0_9ACTN|nr:hypothetical protein SAMN05421748_10583 [Actinoplanes atraurantiacus]
MAAGVWFGHVPVLDRCIQQQSVDIIENMKRFGNKRRSRRCIRCELADGVRMLTLSSLLLEVLNNIADLINLVAQ